MSGRRRIYSAICAGAIILGGCSNGTGSNPGALSRTPRAAPTIGARDAASMDNYYLSTCAVCDGLLGTKGDSPEVSHEGRRCRVCSRDCAQAFAHAPAASIEHVDAVMIVDQRPHYPLAVSLMSGRELGATPVEFIWGNRLFRACDEAERGAILASPGRFMRKLNEEVIKAQASRYGMPDKCPVQGDILPNDVPIDLVVANRMVRVCCARCARVVRARPYQYLGMVEYANRHGEQHP